MIVHQAEQGSVEWHAARAGVITASMFSTVRKKVNGLTEQQQAYVNALLSGLSSADAMAAAGYKTKPRAEGIERALAGEEVGEYSDAAKDYAFRLAIERISVGAVFRLIFWKRSRMKVLILTNSRSRRAANGHSVRACAWRSLTKSVVRPSEQCARQLKLPRFTSHLLGRSRLMAYKTTLASLPCGFRSQAVKLWPIGVSARKRCAS